MRKYKDGWIDALMKMEREREGRLNHTTLSEWSPMESTSEGRTDSMTGYRRREMEV